MIDKITGINGYYATSKRVEKTASTVSSKDSVEISLEAKNKAHQEKIAKIRARLDSYFNNGNIDAEVLNKTAEKMVGDVLSNNGE